MGGDLPQLEYPKDWDVERGLDHLAKFGQFDEVMAGRMRGS